MIDESPAGQPVVRQVLYDNATGFQNGVHHHHYPGLPDPTVAITASAEATRSGHHVGTPIDRWDPAKLGVHSSISVDDDSSLTPYLTRSHDDLLRRVLTDVPDGGPGLVLVVGTSCTGKTRTLYEAVRSVLAGWPLVAPSTDTQLARLLADGTPDKTLVWLDELQDRLTKTDAGIFAAQIMRLLLDTPSVGSILFAGTVWPSNLATLQERPNADAAATGAGAISALLDAAVVVGVPEAFTGSSRSRV